MANLGKWNAPTPTTVLNTELNALGIGAMSAASAVFDNSTGLHPKCEVEVNLDPLTPTAGAYVNIYMLVSVDGTNFPAQSAADLRLTTTQLFCSIPVGVAAATGQRVVSRLLDLPPAKVKFTLDNQLGVAIPANNNSTVKINVYDYNLNG